MVQQNIVSYILTQLRQGQKLEEINDFLLKAGYDKAEVESAVQYVINTQSNPKLAEEQRIQQLTRYIQEQLKTGYTSQVVANFLISKGYPYYEVNSALQQATMPRHEIRVEHRAVAIAAIFMIMVAAGILVMYFKAYTLIGIGMPEKLLDVQTEKLTTIVQQGGEITFNVKLINFGYEKRFDVLLEYKVIERDTNTVVLQKSETAALSTTLEKIVKFSIPEDLKAGNYVVRVDAKYKEYTATSGFIFEVLPKDVAKERLEEIRKQAPVAPVNVTEIPELMPENATPSVPTTPTPTPIPAPGEKKFYEGLTKQQAFEMVKAASVRDPERAVSMCKTLTIPQNIEECIKTIVTFKKNAVYCTFLSQDKQDLCIFELVMQTQQYEFCDQIKDANMKNSCQIMAKSGKVQELSEKGTPEDAAEVFKGFGMEVTPYQAPKLPETPHFG
jgi:hypothetical protein